MILVVSRVSTMKFLKRSQQMSQTVLRFHKIQKSAVKSKFSMWTHIFPSNFHKINHLSHLHSLVLSTKNWCRTYNIHSEIASMFYSNQKETASNTLNMIFWSRNTEIVFSIKMYSNNISFIHSLQCTEYWHASFVSVLSSNFRTNVLVKSIIKWNTTEEYL